MAQMLQLKIRVLKNHKNFRKVFELLNQWMDLREDTANAEKANKKLSQFLSMSNEELIEFADRLAA